MATNPDPLVIAFTVDQLIDHVSKLHKCVIELSGSVRAIIDCQPDEVVLGQLDAIDHVLRSITF